jgi:hypothetical protein
MAHVGMTDPGPGEPHEIPVGRQTIALPPSLAPTLAALPAGARPELVATRIWFEHARGRLVLHIGDVEAGRLDE